MPREFFSFEDIRAAGDCAAFAVANLGVTIKNGRCAAPWRGGTNPMSVSIDRDKWYDHGTKGGGGIIELGALKFAGDKQQAQEFLGNYYRLQPKVVAGPAPERGESRYDKLIAEGYTVARRYDYRDAAGVIVHVTIRLQHPEKPKQFVQGVPTDNGGIRWGLKGVETVLYRLPEIADSPWVILCEGEKSADRLAALGLPTTTAPMGAGKWHESYSEILRWKDVAIFPDNDEPGREHARIVAAALQGVASSVRIIENHSKRPKGGIDDWLDEEEGRGADDVEALIAAAVENAPAPGGPARVAAPESGADEITPAMLAEAKSANSIPFRNYVPVKVEVERGKGSQKKMVEEIKKEPRNHLAMLDDLHRRFLGFPRSVGSCLFDHDRDTGHIIEMERPFQFVAWIARKSKQNPEFSNGDSLARADEFMETARVESRRYEATSDTPDYPRREDTYYTHGPIPPACPERSRLKTLVGFFRPSSEEDRILMTALFCQPLWYIRGIPRPGWIIDARESQGSGKTTLAEMVARLYNGSVLSTSKQELELRRDVLTKRCLSGSGRKSRIVLLDNITGNFSSDELSDWMTREDITGMAPYGRGEECRPNNLTFILTANSASVSHDIADRCLHLFLSKPDLASANRADWKWSVMQYIEDHRLEIVADIIDMVSTHKAFSTPPRTRFPTFERDILQPCCGTEDAYLRVLEHIRATREESDTSNELARCVAETFHFNIAKAIGTTMPRPVFIRTEVVNSWGRQAMNDIGYEYPGKPSALIREMVGNDLFPLADKDLRRWPTSSTSKRYSGLAWGFTVDTKSAIVIGREGDGRITTETIEG